MKKCINITVIWQPTFNISAFINPKMGLWDYTVHLSKTNLKLTISQIPSNISFGNIVLYLVCVKGFTLI